MMKEADKKTRNKRGVLRSGVVFVLVCIMSTFITVAQAATVDKNDLKKDEKKIEKKISKEEKKLQEAKGTLTNVQKTLNVTTVRVSQTEDQLNRIESEIKQREKSIEELVKQLDFQKSVLKSAVRELYYIEREGAVTKLFTQSGNRFLATDHDQMTSLRNRVLDEMAQVKKTKQKVESVRMQLTQQKDAQKELLEKQKRERQALAIQRNQVAQEVQKRAATISELRSELSAVKSKLASLLGKSLKAGDIIEAAKIASKATGVRKDFILGELVVETNLGTYTGGCTYKKANMTKANRDMFKTIAKELDYNYKKLKVSCAPGYGHGGAMGVAQFMPTTWAGYKSRIAAATGHNPPDPWDLTDGVMAMALYLKNKGADRKKGEFEAAKRYYCGSPASRYWNNKCNDYANKVLYWANNYERLIK